MWKKKVKQKLPESPKVMYDTSLSKETTNKNPGQKWIFKSEVKVHEIYPSSLNHGSVKNGCISNRIVTIATFLISRHFPLNHDYGRIRVDCKVTLIFTGGVSPPVHPRRFVWCSKAKLESLSSEIFVEIGGPSSLVWSKNNPYYQGNLLKFNEPKLKIMVSKFGSSPCPTPFFSGFMFNIKGVFGVGMATKRRTWRDFVWRYEDMKRFFTPQSVEDL